MEIANVLLALGGDKGNTIPKFLVTASEIAVLREIHGDDAVTDIDPQGERKTTHRAERERLLAIYGAAKKDERAVVEGLFPGVAARLFEGIHELELPEDFFKATQRTAPGEDASKPSWDAGLRKDGPTIAEWLDAGYTAGGYPPTGYEAKSTPEEVEAEVAARTAAAGEPAPGVAPIKPAGDADDDGDGIDDINDGQGGNVLG